VGDTDWTLLIFTAKNTFSLCPTHCLCVHTTQSTLRISFFCRRR